MTVNATAVDLFTLMRTQWRWSEGRRRGLDYGALPAALWGLGRSLASDKRADALARLQVMEAQALDLSNRVNANGGTSA